MPTAKAARELQIVDPVLSQIARRFKPTGFIYNQLAPSIPVTKDSGLYPVFDDRYWFGDDVDNKVSDRAETPEVDFVWSTEPYLAEDYRLKASITKKERRQAHDALRLEQNKLELVLTRMATRRERRLAAQLRNTANGGALTGGTAVPSAKWDQATATIELDMQTGKLAVYTKTGKVPNTIVIPYEVACKISIQEDIREILKYTVNGQDILRLGEAVLPATLWGMRVVIPMGTLVQQGRVDATKSLVDIWSDNVLLLYVDPGAGWGIPSVAYSFKAETEVVDRWRENDPPVEYVRAWECVDEKVCAPELGYEIEDVLT